MNISTDIKIVKSWLDMYDALAEEKMKKDSEPIYNAMKNVVLYAEKCYKEECASEPMEQLTKILTGEKDEEIKKH